MKAPICARGSFANGAAARNTATDASTAAAASRRPPRPAGNLDRNSQRSSVRPFASISRRLVPRQLPVPRHSPPGTWMSRMEQGRFYVLKSCSGSLDHTSPGNVMPYEALSSCSKIRALGFCLGSVALLVLLGSCKNGNPDASSRIPINTAAGWSDSPFISGDGQRPYFTYSSSDFGPGYITLRTRPPVLSGPDSAGPDHNPKPFADIALYGAT